MQGTGALTLAGDRLSQGSNGRWLTAGDLSLSGKTLNTAGTTQGHNLIAQADSWTNNGSVLATGNLNATLGASLLNNGDLMRPGQCRAERARADQPRQHPFVRRNVARRNNLHQ
ncbi:Uncharacterised protein [Raoultella terrigena]|uniref:Adhesin HecA family 20-residue repeat (Two copies) n=1 Tax=Raoultella terrigena TaxID=577 RepID=A0A3P8J4L2_RAOTE|nr:Uncharacterised protein [Raoultella terrigena]